MGSGLAEAIPGFYDAAVDHNQWVATLDQAVKPLGAVGALVIVVENDSASPAQWNFQQFSSLFVNASPGVAQHIEKNFFHYEQEAWDFFSRQPERVIHADNEFWPEPNLDNRDDYQYAIANLGVRRRLAARLNGNRAWFDNLAIQFHPGHLTVPSVARQAMQKLLPHAAKAVELSRTFNLLEAKHNAVLAALNYVDIGLCILLPTTEVVVANNEAERILDNADSVKKDRFGLLRCRDTARNAELSDAVQRASLSARGEGDVAEVLLVLERASSRHPLLIEVVPLRDASSEIDHDLSGALVTLIDAENPKPFNTVRVAKAYKLTGAETAVCKLLVDGWTNNNIADERNVSPETVKAQVASVFSKTGTQRRSDLIRLVLRASPPVR